MSIRQTIIKEYFKSWINKDSSILLNNFHEDAEYFESWGPAYNGINQLEEWFLKWNKKGKVIKWEIKDIIESDNKIICEWYFEFEYNKKNDNFNGVTIASFDDNNKIILLKEFMSVLPTEYPLS